MITTSWLKRGTLVRNFLEKYIVGRSCYQWFFSKLHLFSIAGLNYGEGSEVGSSGEGYVMKWFSEEWTSSRPPVIFDVGANKGNYTSAMLTYITNSCVIHAFEPSRETYELLCKNVNNTKVIKHNFGFSGKNEKIVLFSNVSGSGLASVYKRETTVEMDRQEDIELRTIDSFCEEERITMIDFMKLDTEGHELEVLHGAKQMLANRAIRNIQFEFGGCNVDSRTYFHDFWQLLHNDFDVYRILKDGLYLVKEYSLLDEIFVTVNFLAVLKKS